MRSETDRAKVNAFRLIFANARDGRGCGVEVERPDRDNESHQPGGGVVVAEAKQDLEADHFALASLDG